MTLDIAVLAFLLAFVLWGAHRGLAKVIFSAVSSLVSLIAGYLLYRPLVAYLDKIGVADGLAAKMEASGVLGSLPGIMRDLPLTSSAAGEMYRSLASAAVCVISFAAVVIIVKLILFFVSAIIGVTSSLPVIHQANGLAGGLLGFALGALFLLLIFAVLGSLEAFGRLGVMSSWLDGSHIAALIYNNNPLLGLIIK